MPHLPSACPAVRRRQRPLRVVKLHLEAVLRAARAELDDKRQGAALLEPRGRTAVGPADDSAIAAQPSQLDVAMLRKPIQQLPGLGVTTLPPQPLGDGCSSPYFTTTVPGWVCALAPIVRCTR